MPVLIFLADPPQGQGRRVELNLLRRDWLGEGARLASRKGLLLAGMQGVAVGLFTRPQHQRAVAIRHARRGLLNRTATSPCGCHSQTVHVAHMYQHLTHLENKCGSIA